MQVKVEDTTLNASGPPKPANVGNVSASKMLVSYFWADETDKESEASMKIVSKTVRGVKFPVYTNTHVVEPYVPLKYFKNKDEKEALSGGVKRAKLSDAV